MLYESSSESERTTRQKMYKICGFVESRTSLIITVITITIIFIKHKGYMFRPFKDGLNSAGLQVCTAALCMETDSASLLMPAYTHSVSGLLLPCQESRGLTLLCHHYLLHF
jgi:hypothetical protein